MQNNFDTSFIPQQPLLRVEGTKSRKEPINFALILALIIFFVVLIMAGGIYFYSKQIDARVLARAAELESLELALDAKDVSTYKEVDSRIRVAKAIVRDHRVFSVILDVLEVGTASNVGLNSLEYTINDVDGASVSVSGVAPTYDAVYFQFESWRALAPLVTRIDSDLVTLDDLTGLVKFRAKISLSLDYMGYAKVYATSKAPQSDESLTPLSP
jgi:hypothetical protein